uniref:Putative LAGLIDADG homing endonuclease n=1 Tax=Jenufa perforata TaxID=993091 RepID=A0A0S2LNE0_9CHLO|nr:putative LAGLIDADG homing endonuclease [Jenufa perforata]ALO62912.1 putative LAGLIDADG homing endonuclease [Jenufa perforata]
MHKKKDKKTEEIKQYRGFAFSTRALFRKKWRDLFYVPLVGKGKRKYRKQIPKSIKSYFWGNLALTIFFLDDGWYDSKKKTVRLSTGEWSRQECEWLTDCLLKNFNLQTKIYPLTGNPHHIYIKRNSYNEFYRRVNPFLEKFARDFPKYPLSLSMKNRVLVK